MKIIAKRRGYYDGRSERYDCPYPPNRSRLTRYYRRGFREGSRDQGAPDEPGGDRSEAA